MTTTRSWTPPGTSSGGKPRRGGRQADETPAAQARARAEQRRHRRTPSAAWRVMLSYSAPHRRALAAGGVCTLLGGLTGLAQPLIAKRVMEKLAFRQNVVPSLILLGVIVLVGAAIGATGYFILERTGEAVVLDARMRLIMRVLRLRVAVTEHTSPGDLLSRVSADTTLLRQVTTQTIVSTFNAGLMLVGTVILMGVLDPLMLLVTLGVVSLMVVVVTRVMPRIARALKQVQASVGFMAAMLERALSAFRTVKASGAEERQIALVEASAIHAWKQGVQVARWQALAGAAAALVVQVSFLVVLGFGGARVASGAIQLPTLIAFLLYLFYLTNPITQLVQAVSQFQLGKAASGRIQEVMNLDIELANSAADRVEQTAPHYGLATTPASVTFLDVQFRYGPDQPIIHHNVTFQIPPGGMTALVGPSGAGKSTVFALLERFYDVTAGHVLVDGRDVRAWPLAELRATIGYVEQDSSVLAGTLRDNLLFGAPNATEDEIREVLARTRLESLVAKLPMGLDTMVGNWGMTLSGGERQRVAIARALLRRPRLLLLDEATSQLDAANETALKEAINEAANTTTVIVVAHRLSTVTQARRIIVFEAGRVRSIGSHEELVRHDPLYRDLAATQLLTAET